MYYISLIGGPLIYLEFPLHREGEFKFKKAIRDDIESYYENHPEFQNINLWYNPLASVSVENRDIQNETQNKWLDTLIDIFERVEQTTRLPHFDLWKWNGKNFYLARKAIKHD
jgi:hypothetical protein